MGRAGEEEPSGAALGVDRPLDRPEQIRRPLYLVDDGGAGETRDKSLGIAPGGFEGREVVQSHVAFQELLADELSRHRGLPDLPGSDQENGRELRKRTPDEGENVSANHV